MFCPRCATQNKTDQKFCRGCGLSLSSVRLALEGKVDEATAELRQSFDKLGSGVGTMGFSFLATAINSFLWDWGVLINLILGFLITIRLFHRGFKQMERAVKTLEGKEQQPASPAIAAASQPNSQIEPMLQSELSL